MFTPEGFAHLIDALAQHETRLGVLYTTFATVFAAHRSLWSQLAYEERVHAHWLRRLQELQAAGKIGRSPQIPITPQAVASSFNYVLDLTTQAQAGAFDDVRALAIARDLEQAVLETRFPQLFTYEDPLYQRIPDALAEETSKHHQALNTALRQAQTQTMAQILTLPTRQPE